MEYRTRDIVAEGVAMGQGSYRHVGQFVGMVAGRMLARIGERAEARGDTLAWPTATVTVSRFAAQEWAIEAVVHSDDPDAPPEVNDGTVSPVEHWRGRAAAAEEQVQAALEVLRNADGNPMIRRAVAILSGVDDEDPGSPWR